MPPLNFEIDLSQPIQASATSDDCSVSSEISLDLLFKENDENDDRNGSTSSSGGWNPDDSDYSLNVILGSSEPLDESTKSSLMGSDYSLNVKLTKTQEENTQKPEPKRSPPTRTRSSETLEAPPPPVSPNSPDRSNPSKLPSSNKVSFFPRVRIQRVPNRKDLRREEVHAVWYSRSEFKEIRQECFDTLTIMADGNEIFDDEDNTFCIRGLEYKTKGEYKKRQRNKIEIRMCVFEEQEFQQDNNMNDPEYIADLSRDSSRSCVRAAIEAARQDEEDAIAYLTS